MSVLGSALMVFFGFVSLLGYVLLFAVLLYYLRDQGDYRGTPSSSSFSSDGVASRVADRSAERVLATVQNASGNAPDRTDDGALAYPQCPQCGLRNNPDYDYCSNCIAKLSGK